MRPGTSRRAPVPPRTRGASTPRPILGAVATVVDARKPLPARPPLGFEDRPVVVEQEVGVGAAKHLADLVAQHRRHLRVDERRLLSLIHISEAHETVLDLVCRLLLEK